MTKLHHTWLPFLYPCLYRTDATRRSTIRAAEKLLRTYRIYRYHSSVHTPAEPVAREPPSHLNPDPSDYSRFLFKDKCTLTVVAGSGGNGCVSFLREKYIDEGPPNGGDGGSGGSIYIQAIDGLTSLHKLARRGIIRAGRGKNGRGKSQGGKRGHDVVIQVPVGTVVREVGRYDPIAEEERRLQELREEMSEEEALRVISARRFVMYPGSQPSDFLTMNLPTLPPPQRSPLAALEPPAPIYLDLSKHMDKPMLLAAGGVGGLGNPHFVSRSIWRPRFGTKGEGGLTLHLELELKLLADVGLVGFPNVGKSTLLRSLTNSRTRIGNWEFTTLSPSIGTVILDNFKGRPLIDSANKSRRTRFTIADIPGLVEDAHLDRGLGLGFLRHIERAGILGFVVDLSTGNPVQQLQKLWHEIGEYDRMRNEPSQAHSQTGPVSWIDLGETTSKPSSSKSLPPLSLPPISKKPWFVVATKADLPNTQENFMALQQYVSAVQAGTQPHPSGHKDAFRERLVVIPVSAIRAEGVESIPGLVMSFLDKQ